MKKKKILTDIEKLEVLRLLSQAPKMSQENVAAETHHRKAKIGGVLKEFKSLDWESAKAFCDNDQNILRLREDYLQRKVAEASDQEETLKAFQESLRHELGLPSIITYKKGGVWMTEF